MQLTPERESQLDWMFVRMFNESGCDIGYWPLGQFLRETISGGILLAPGDRLVVEVAP